MTQRLIQATMLAASAVIFVVGLTNIGCERKPWPPPPPTEKDEPKSPASGGTGVPASTPTKYTVRGIIKQLPVEGDPRTAFMVHHEAIPGFQKDGKVIGMAEMTMAFPLGPGVTLDGLRVGQKIELDLEVIERPSVRYYASRVVPLPGETKIELNSGG
jgi:Cu/Ag efflux protein CusF